MSRSARAEGATLCAIPISTVLNEPLRMSLKRTTPSSDEDEASSPSSTGGGVSFPPRPKHHDSVSGISSAASSVRIVFFTLSSTVFLPSSHHQQTLIPHATQQNTDAFALMMASSRTLHKQEVEQERFRSVLRAMNLLQDAQQQGFCAFCRSNGRTSVPAIGVCAFCEKPCCDTGCSRVCCDCGGLFCLTCSVIEFVSNSPFLHTHLRLTSPRLVGCLLSYDTPSPSGEAVRCINCFQAQRGTAAHT